MFLYDNMIKGELQTEDGFVIVSTKQEPSLTNVQTQHEDGTDSSAPIQQNVKSETESDQQFEGKTEPEFNAGVKKEMANDNPDRCTVCNEKLTVNQKSDAKSETPPTSTADNYIGHGVVDQRRKCTCSEIKTDPSDIKTESWRMGKLDSDPVLTSHDIDRQSDNDIPDCDAESETRPTSSTAENYTGHSDTSLTVRRNPSRSAKRNVLYHVDQDDFEADLNEDHSLNGVVDNCRKSSQDRQSDVSEKPSECKEKRFKCNVCHKYFTQSGQLQLHIRTVHDKSFTKAYILKQHYSAVHCKVKPFPCHHCPYKSTQRGSLKLHIRTVHDMVKPFSCPHCPYKAAKSSNLERHIRTHTGEKNYKCDICDQKFSVGTTLKQHISAVHDKVKHPCPYCSYKAAWSSSLERHIKTKHSISVIAKEWNITCIARGDV